MCFKADQPRWCHLSLLPKRKNVCLLAECDLLQFSLIERCIYSSVMIRGVGSLTTVSAIYFTAAITSYYCINIFLNVSPSGHREIRLLVKQKLESYKLSKLCVISVLHSNHFRPSH